MLVSLVWIFFKLGFLFNDTTGVEDYLHREIVVKKQIMTEDEFNSIHSIGKVSLISYKLTFAFSVGMKKKGISWGILLAMQTLLPNLILYFIVLVWLLEMAESTILLYVTSAIAPVMAAYFVYQSFVLLKKGYSNFPLIPFIVLCTIGFTLVFILRWPVAITLSATLLLFLCFMKGGNING